MAKINRPDYKDVASDVRYLKLLARDFPTISKVTTEIINLEAILHLPKSTEHFLADLHGEIIDSNRFPFYNAEYYKVLPFIVELRNRGDKDVSEIETCLNALYGTMMLRLQGKKISPDTEHAVKEISTFLGMLSDYHIKDKTEGLRFDDEEEL